MSGWRWCSSLGGPKRSNWLLFAMAAPAQVSQNDAKLESQSTTLPDTSYDLESKPHVASETLAMFIILIKPALECDP